MTSIKKKNKKNTKKKISWVTPDYFIDVDLPAIKSLNENDFSYVWHVIFTKNNITTYNRKTIANELGSTSGILHLIYLKRRIRSFNTFLDFFELAITIKKEKPV